MIANQIMPSMRGAQFLEMVRASNPNVLTVLCSGHSEEDETQMQGMAELRLPKPITLAELSGSIRALLDARAGRKLRVTRGEDGVTALEEDGKKTSWRVVSRQHRPSKAALKDAGERAKRDVVRVTWAVPLLGRREVGHLWAFFPTGVRTTLAGIVNAPWKMGDDRRNLIEGPFNQELLTGVLPPLISAEWRQLQDPSDPSGILDTLPARGKEARSWADEVLNRPVFMPSEQLHPSPTQMASSPSHQNCGFTRPA